MMKENSLKEILLSLKKNIDNGIDSGDIDFKAFKKKLTSVYKKLLKGDDKEK